jgi:hypothetical protein
MTYDRLHGTEDQYLYDNQRNVNTYKPHKTMTLTHSFIDVALKRRVFGIRRPELLDDVILILVQVIIDNVDDS